MRVVQIEKARRERAVYQLALLRGATESQARQARALYRQGNSAWRAVAQITEGAA